jgi:hypothetical protein
LFTAKTPAGPTTYAFDATGNQSQSTAPGAARTTWAWDYENRLTKVQLPVGVRNTFSYNADGLRVQKQASTGTTKPVWDAENIILETDQNNATLAVYTTAPSAAGNLVSQYRNGASLYMQFDGVGSTDRLTNASGVVTDTYLYQAFGTIATRTGTTTNPFTFQAQQGYYYDVDPEDYFGGFKYYDGGIGRLLGGVAEAFQVSLNAYAPTGGQPLWRDGRYPKKRPTGPVSSSTVTKLACPFNGPFLCCADCCFYLRVDYTVGQPPWMKVIENVSICMGRGVINNEGYGTACKADLLRTTRPKDHIFIETVDGTVCVLTANSFPPNDFGIRPPYLSPGCQKVFGNTQVGGDPKGNQDCQIGNTPMGGQNAICYNIPGRIRYLVVQFGLKTECCCGSDPEGCGDDKCTYGEVRIDVRWPDPFPTLPPRDPNLVR